MCGSGREEWEESLRIFCWAGREGRKRVWLVAVCLRSSLCLAVFVAALDYTCIAFVVLCFSMFVAKWVNDCPLLNVTG